MRYPGKAWHSQTDWEQSRDQSGVSVEEGVLSAKVFNIPETGTNQWHIDEGSGTTLNDSLGSTTATINGATWQSESGAVGGQYLSHNGTDNFWETDAAIGVKTQQTTVCGWARLNSFTGFNNPIVSSGQDGVSGGGWYVADDSNNGQLLTVEGGDTDNGSVLSGVPFATAGNWGFFAIMLDGNTHRLITFDNSQELADQSSTNQGSTYTRTYENDILSAGYRSSGPAYLDGDLDFIAVQQSGLLSKQEITDIWDSTRRR